MTALRIDIVSDVVCPWCIVGYRQLAQALEKTGVTAEIHWQPFELNPEMAAEGEHLGEHIKAKYGSSEAESAANRDRLTTLGETLGFDFQFTPDSRIYPTFKAHQLLAWANESGQEHALKLALFKAYFSEGRNINDNDVLLDVAASAGLDAHNAESVLASEQFAQTVRQNEQFWTSQGIRGVPAVVIDQKYLLSGAQGVDRFAEAVEQVMSERAGGQAAQPQ